MRLLWLVALTMTAFAANSILNRVGVAQFGLHPLGFAAIRVAAGAAMLWVLVAARAQPAPAIWTPKRLTGAVALATYMVGFSLAYLSLGAGLGALVLFGALQIIIFGWATIERQTIAPQRWIGAGIALTGLCILLWPTGISAPPFTSVVAMIAAAAGWAAYTLLGRAEADPLGATASNFLLCVPLTSLGFFAGGPMPPLGVATAMVAGAITSGLGYALWYRVLPALPTTIAGIAQLSVPVIAVTGGVAFLGETLTPKLISAGTIVLIGIAVSLIARK